MKKEKRTQEEILADIAERQIRLDYGMNGYELIRAYTQDLKRAICVRPEIALSDGYTIKQGLPNDWFDGRCDTENENVFTKNVSLEEIEMYLNGETPECNTQDDCIAI